MEESKVLIAQTEGSVLSDTAVRTTAENLDIMRQQAQTIGELRGELKVAEELIDRANLDYEKDLDEAKKIVDIVIKSPGAVKQRTSVYHDPWGGIIQSVVDDPANVEVVTKNIEDLKELADATVTAEAKLATDEAEKVKKDAEHTKKSAENLVKEAEKKMDALRKKQIEVTQKAVDSAERDNLRSIADLKLEIQALQKEADLMLDEKRNLAKERDLALEAKEAQLNLYRNRLNILERSPKRVLESIKSKIYDGWFRRRIKRLESC